MHLRCKEPSPLRSYDDAIQDATKKIHSRDGKEDRPDHDLISKEEQSHPPSPITKTISDGIAIVYAQSTTGTIHPSTHWWQQCDRC